MYEKARRGESIEIPPRRISIFQFDIKRSLDDRLDISHMLCAILQNHVLSTQKFK